MAGSATPGDGLLRSIAAEGVTVDLPDLVRQGASRAGEYMAAELGRVIRNIVVFLFELFVMLFALFYFLRDGDSMLDRFRHFLPFEETMTERMLAEARELIFASVTTSLVIAAVQGSSAAELLQLWVWVRLYSGAW